MKKTSYIKIAVLFSVFAVTSVSAQALVYTPQNPSFGGNTFNHQWMMSEATAQNGFTDDGSSKYDPYSRNPLDDFQESLNRQILSQLSRQLIGNAFGEDQIKEGKYELGDYIIDISEGAEGVNINILDNTTGDETTVVVPYL